jgi:hypothetical protein
MVVGFTITYAISAYHHWCCEFKSPSGRGVQHYVIKFVSDLRQGVGYLRILWFPPPKNWPLRYSWNIVESGVKQHQTKKQTNKRIYIGLHAATFYYLDWFIHKSCITRLQFNVIINQHQSATEPKRTIVNAWYNSFLI